MTYIIKPSDDIQLPSLTIKEGELFYKKISFHLDYPKCCEKEAELYIETKEILPNGLYFLIQIEGDKKEWNITKNKIRLNLNQEKFNLIIRYDKSKTGLDICKIINNVNFIIKDNCTQKNCTDKGVLINKYYFDIEVVIPLYGRLEIDKKPTKNNNDGIIKSWAWGCCIADYTFQFYYSGELEFGEKQILPFLKSNITYEKVYLDKLKSGWYHVKISAPDCLPIWKSIYLEPYPELTLDLIPELKFSECYDPCEELDVDCITIYQGKYKKKYWNISKTGASDGHVSIIIKQGTPPFFYYWAGPFTTELEANNKLPLQENELINKTSTLNDLQKKWGVGDLINVKTGWYASTIKDSYGNEVNNVVFLNEPPIPSGDIEGTDVQLYGQSNGSLKVNIDGHTAPYSFFWKYSPHIQKNYHIDCNDDKIYEDSNIIKRRGDKLLWEYEKDTNLNPIKVNSWDWSCEYYNNGEFIGEYFYYNKQEFYAIKSDLPIPLKKSLDNSFFEYSPPQQGVKAGIYDLTLIDCTGLALKGREVIIQPDPLVICTKTENACIWGGFGNATLLIEWGNPPFIIDISKGGFSSITIDENPPIKYIFNDLLVGEYEIKVSDKLGQLEKRNIIIFQPEDWDFLIDTFDIKLIGTNSGKVKIEIITLNNTPYDIPNTYSYNLYKLPEMILLGNQKEWDNLNVGKYKMIVIPEPLLCQKQKEKEFEIKEPELIDFNFEYLCECCTGIDGYIKINNIKGGYDTNYIYKWYFNGELLNENKSNLNNPKTGTYIIEVYDSVGNFTSKKIEIPIKEKICFTILDKKDLIQFGSKEGFIKVKKTINGIDPVFWRIYKQNNLFFTEINPPMNTIDNMTIQWNNLDKGTYKIQIKDKCSSCEEIIEIKEKPNPCLDPNGNPELFYGKSFFTINENPINLEVNKPKKLNININLERSLCCTSEGKGLPEIGTAYFNIQTGYPAIKFTSVINDRATIQNGGKTLVIREPQYFPTSNQNISVNLDYDGTLINETNLTISGNLPCFQGIVIPIKLKDCCSNGCCDRSDCCPEKYNECCCPKDIVCKDINHPRFLECCKCNDLSISTKNAMCVNPKFIGTPIYNDCCKCNDIPKDVINNTICNDPNHPQLETCCNCREHRVLREKVCRSPNPQNNPLFTTCCPCDMIKDQVCSDKNHPRYVECCNPCEPDCCKNGNCSDVRLCCDCKDFDLNIICLDEQHPFYTKCCNPDCCDQ